MKFSFFIILFASVLAGATGAGSPQEINLSEKRVKELALSQGPKAREVQLKYQQYRLDLIKTQSSYDWNLLAESGIESDKSAGLRATGTTVIPEYERFRTTMSLQKSFESGTLLGIELNRLSQKINTSPFSGNAPPSQQALDSAGVILEQALWGNFLGVADKAILTSAELNLEAYNLSRANEMEDVVLEALRQFWNSYVSYEAAKNAVDSRNRYKILVNAVKRKKTLGYTNPGDLPQVLAEFETREQKVRTTTIEYQKNIEVLLTLLALNSDTQVHFEIPQNIRPIPQWKPKKPDDLRAVRSQKLRIEAAENNLTAAESTSSPTFKVVGKAYTTGAGDSSLNSLSEMSSGTKPRLYLGVKFQYNFGSSVQAETIQNKKSTKELEENRLHRLILESQDQLTQAERQTQSAYEIVLSTQRQLEFREKASQELNRSYGQGRTDISILITSLNNFFDSEAQHYKALGDYAIAISQWAAARDELNPDPLTD